MKLSKQEVGLVVQLLDSVEVKGLATMSALLGLAQKCQAFLNPPEPPPEEVKP